MIISSYIGNAWSVWKESNRRAPLRSMAAYRSSRYFAWRQSPSTAPRQDSVAGNVTVLKTAWQTPCLIGLVTPR